ncbi:MAG: holA [Cyanobacteria bacterium RYN_339]|nr:holA [Cyanobacteria bacterium RYN_339]
MGLYLLHGDDAFAVAEARQKLEAKLLDPAWKTFNLTVLPPDTPISKVMQAVLAVPFGAGSRMVVIKDPAFLNGKTEDPGIPDFEKLIEQGLPPGSDLVITCSKLDGRLKLAKKVLGAATVREYGQPKPWQLEEQLSPWVERLANDRQRRIRGDAISVLLQATGGDRYRIQREIEKLTTYAPEGTAITPEMVRELVAGGEVEIFALTEALARRQAGPALVALDKLLTTDHALKVLAAVGTILRNWWKLKLLQEQGRQAADIARETGQRSDFKVKKDLDMLRGWKAAQLEQALEAVLEVDLAIKGGKWPPDAHQALVERAIAKMLITA